MLPALNEIAVTQSKPLFHTKLATAMLLYYTHTYSTAKIHYHARDMILHVKSDAAYSFMSGDIGLIYGHYYLSNHPTNPINT